MVRLSISAATMNRYGESGHLCRTPLSEEFRSMTIVNDACFYLVIEGQDPPYQFLGEGEEVESSFYKIHSIESNAF